MKVLVLLAGVLVPIAMVLALKVLPHSPLTKRLTAGGFSFEDGRAVDERDERPFGSQTTPLFAAVECQVAGRREEHRAAVAEWTFDNGRHGARIGGEEVAPGGQHIRTAPVG